MILRVLRKSKLWKFIRKRRILKQHQRVAEMCEELIKTYDQSGISGSILVDAKKELSTTKVIWQYWAQGFDNVPEVVRKCIDSVDKWRGDYEIVRITDANVKDYIELPDYVWEKKERGLIPIAQFSDILRVCLLSVYGGVWLDATVFLSGNLPEKYEHVDFFAYQRDPNEPNKAYWENAYAYYYGWDDGFRVRMLSSVIFSKKNSKLVTLMSHLLLFYWEANNNLPDYFFIQILFDVLIKDRWKEFNCEIESDCKPHYLQQLRNDETFCFMKEEGILRLIPIHKLTYK